MLRILTLKNIVFVLWFICIVLMIFGSSVGLHYRYALISVLLSIIVILQNYTKPSKLVKAFILFIVVTVVSSYHYYKADFQIYPFKNVLSYSVSAFFVVWASYSYSKTNSRTASKIIFILFFLLYLIGQYRFYRSNYFIYNVWTGVDIQNNAFYYVLMPLPVLFLQKNKTFNAILLIASGYACLLSLKRSGVIVILILGIFSVVEILKSKKKIGAVLLLICMAYGVGYLMSGSVAQERASLVSERMQTMKDDGGSGRTTIIQNFFRDDINDITRIPEIFIGNGFEAYSAKYHFSITSTHNDFLEVFYSFGITGLILFIYIFLSIIKRWWHCQKNNSPYLFPAFSAMVLFLMYSMVGNNFYFYHLSMPLFIYLGHSEALFEHDK